MKGFFKAFVTSVCLAALVFTFMSEFGRAFIKDKFCIENVESVLNVEKVEDDYVDYHLEKQILSAMSNARSKAYNYVEREVENLMNEIMERADNGFIDEYFSFANVKQREIMAMCNGIAHIFNKNSDSAEEAIIKELETKISSEVIKPEVCQERIENITNRAVSEYIDSFARELTDLKSRYNIPDVKWDNYITNICKITVNTEIGCTPVSYKTLTVSGLALTGAAAAPLIKGVLTKVSSKTIAKTASVSVPVIGLGIAAVVCIWDIIDYNTSAEKGRYQLRTNLRDYLQEVKNELTGSGNQGIMYSITEWEKEIQGNLYSRF